MAKLGVFIFLAFGTLGCTSVGSDSWTSAYTATAHCHSYDYAHTSSMGCIGRTWH